MHRRGLRALPDLSGRTILSSLPEASCSRRHYVLLPTRSPPRHPPDVPVSQLEELPGRLVDTAIRKEGKKGWRHDKANTGETRRISAVVKNKARLPSAEKTKFFSAPSEEAWDTSLRPLEVSGKQRVQPGTFVEVRRNEESFIGIALFDVNIMSRWTVHTLMSTGEVWAHAEEDIMFAVASFADRDLVSRCGTEIFALNEQQIASRVRMLKRLRNFQIGFEELHNRLLSTLKTVYQHFKADNPNQWSQVTTAQVARFIDTKAKDTSTISTLTSFVAHKYLFSRSKYFVAEPVSFLEKQTFWVRPVRHVQRMETVDEMIARKDSRLDSFIHKAKVLVAASHKRRIATWNEAPSMVPDRSIHWTEDDMTIIRFLLDSLRSKRSTQVDPHIVLQSAILKKIPQYNEAIDDPLLQQFLIDIGILPPWEDLITREDLSERLSVLPAIKTPPPHAITRPPPDVLDASGLYSHDIAESIRHEFGNMPVYVVDDVDAHELDDGVSVERIPSEPGYVWLHVHIADPTVVLPPTHEISQQARMALSTAYWIDRTVPMLPRNDSLANRSLRHTTMSDDPQTVVTFSAKIDDRGGIVDYNVRAGLIRNVVQLHYAEVDTAMRVEQNAIQYPFHPPSIGATRTSPITPAIMEDLLALRSITHRLMAQRVRNGAISYDIMKAQMRLKDSALPSRNPAAPHSYAFSGFPELEYSVFDFRMMDYGARGLINESMKTACRVASLFFRDRGIPAIRRTVPRSFTSLEGGYEALLAERDETGYVDHFLALRLGLLGEQSRYDLAPKGHDVIGVPDGEGYVRVTSPLRRYSDMVAHWQVKHALLHPGDTHGRVFSDDWLETFARDLGFREVLLKRAQSTQNNYWALQYIQRRIEERARTGREVPVLDRLTARVSGYNVFNMRKGHYQVPVIIPMLGLKANLVVASVENVMNIGDTVDVEIEAIRLGLRPNLLVVGR